MRRRRLVILAACLSAAIGPGSAAPLLAEPLTADATAPQVIMQTGRQADVVDEVASTIKVPPGFSIQRFALVPGARAMAVSPDGRKVVVGTLEDQAYVLDLAGAGGPVSAVRTFAPTIPKAMPHGVCFAPDGTLFLAEQNRILAFAYSATAADRQDVTARVVVPQGKLIPAAFESHGHSARVCRVGPDGKLYVTIGQPTNVPSVQQWKAFEAHGLGAILRMTQSGSERETYAGGIRNSVGLDFDPKDGTLWFTDNQVDMMGDDIPPGELNHATKAGQSFGFPFYGGGHVRTHEWAAASPPAASVFPAVEMTAHAADLGMTFYRGRAFPAAYRGGIFSAQHGSWNRTVPVGARIMFTRVGADGKAVASPFATGWLTESGSYHGRPADVAELSDGSLLVSDDDLGAIYRISYHAP